MSSTSSTVVTLSSFNLLFFTQVLTVLTTTTIKYNEYVTDKGKNITIPCIAEGNIMWVKENGNNSTIVQTGKFLVLTNVTAADSGLYVCFASVPATTTAAVATTTQASMSVVSAEAERTTKTTAETSVSSNTLPEDALKLADTSAVTHVYRMQPTTDNGVVHATMSNVTFALTTSPLPNDDDDDNDEQRSSLSSISSNSNTSRSNSTSISVNVSTLPTTSTTTTTTTTSLTTTIPTHNVYDELEYQAFQKIKLIVRTPPGPVTQLYFKASTILGFLIWRFNKTQSGGYPLRSFTAEYRNISYKETPYNSSFEHEWSRMDPINIAPNVRQMEVYRLAPNTTYEFRIWANNVLGSGDVVTTNVTTLPETKEEDLIRLIQPDLENFDPRIWIVAVSIVLGTLVILAIGLCIVLSKECYQSSQMEVEDGWDSIELIPNIILNPGFSDSDAPDGGVPHFTRTIIFGDDDEDDDDEDEDVEPTMEKFKRKVSVFFTGPTIKRI